MIISPLLQIYKSQTLNFEYFWYHFLCSCVYISIIISIPWHTSIAAVNKNAHILNLSKRLTNVSFQGISVHQNPQDRPEHVAFFWTAHLPFKLCNPSKSDHRLAASLEQPPQCAALKLPLQPQLQLQHLRPYHPLEWVSEASRVRNKNLYQSLYY